MRPRTRTHARPRTRAARAPRSIAAKRAALNAAIADCGAAMIALAHATAPPRLRPTLARLRRALTTDAAISRADAALLVRVTTTTLAEHFDHLDLATTEVDRAQMRRAVAALSFDRDAAPAPRRHRTTPKEHRP